MFTKVLLWLRSLERLETFPVYAGMPGMTTKASTFQAKVAPEVVLLLPGPTYLEKFSWNMSQVSEWLCKRAQTGRKSLESLCSNCSRKSLIWPAFSMIERHHLSLHICVNVFLSRRSHRDGWPPRIFAFLTLFVAPALKWRFNLLTLDYWLKVCGFKPYSVQIWHVHFSKKLVLLSEVQISSDCLLLYVESVTYDSAFRTSKSATAFRH